MMMTPCMSVANRNFGADWLLGGNMVCNVLCRVIAVVPNRGAICNTQGCREMILFSIYHRNDIFKMSPKLKTNCYRFATRCRKLYTIFEQGDTKIRSSTKSQITSKIVFRLTQNFSYIRSSLCSRHLQSFKSVLQKLFVPLALKKCVPNELPDAAGTFGSGGQSSR